MNLAEAEDRAWSLMCVHGLVERGWTFAFDRAKCRYGLTNFRTRRISLSRQLTATALPDEVQDTILHEIAHALAGPHHHHDAYWKEIATSLGATPRRGRRRAPDAPRPASKWIAVCPKGHILERHRRSRHLQSCGRCDRNFNTHYLLTYYPREAWEARTKPGSAA
ncbi:SprT-like domain-containing protein [Actinobaculum massiliense]|uniref:SprT-like domain-containing protein n=1 Tax=Actinobaculum massiliense ACS-171-V-Col2 TaxID=883066 RepID=K9F373_9ACTO|nr:SprT-like domain-containing protein [Actinobaculum massiliense]EKU95870.1 hypothetical protein HMPREF9233_00657 [Actinobaculum massiliense ACS-171-V-Col2]MDK8318743.1 SprT-like domain-containing protein [Actinobaculum massiliense]MDK8566421.1 SprT-like domain-containing protein [Actinobaculum massiliense]